MQVFFFQWKDINNNKHLMHTSTPSRFSYWIRSVKGFFTVMYNFEFNQTCYCKLIFFHHYLKQFSSWPCFFDVSPKNLNQYLQVGWVLQGLECHKFKKKVLIRWILRWFVRTQEELHIVLMAVPYSKRILMVKSVGDKLN